MLLRHLTVSLKVPLPILLINQSDGINGKQRTHRRPDSVQSMGSALRMYTINHVGGERISERQAHFKFSLRLALDLYLKITVTGRVCPRLSSTFNSRASRGTR
jgi:hypothetical protein